MNILVVLVTLGLICSVTTGILGRTFFESIELEEEQRSEIIIPNE